MFQMLINKGAGSTEQKVPPVDHFSDGDLKKSMRAPCACQEQQCVISVAAHGSQPGQGSAGLTGQHVPAAAPSSLSA